MKKRITLFSRSLAIVLAAFALTFGFNACNNKDSQNVQRFKDAAMKLDQTHHTLVNEFDYWPECGIRVTGSHLASLISLTDLEGMLPCPLYVSGPHHNGRWDLENEFNFGHYNPEAIEYLGKIAKKVVADKNFVKLSKPLIDEYLFRQMHIMMVLHDAVYDENLCPVDYREVIFNEMIRSNGYGDDAFYVQAVLALEDGSFVYSNTSDRFLYWWARRWKDGTIDQFYDILSTVYKAYYPEYEFHLEDYLAEGEWEGDYEWENDIYLWETKYNCDLEPDEPIKPEERINESDAIDMIKSAALNLEESHNILDDEYDYWPKGGLRITGSHLFSLITLRTLNRMLPCDLYVSGPHHYSYWELYCSYDFGRYNPEAVRYLNMMAQKVVADEQFVERTRPLVDRYLKTQMYTMMTIYDRLHNKQICDDMNEILVNSMENEGHTYGGTIAGEFLQQMPDYDSEDYPYCDSPAMCLYWWARRNSDGTMDLFHDGLSTIYRAYYPEEYLQFHPSYVVIDGADLRLRLTPSTTGESLKWKDGSNRHPNVGERFPYLGETGDFYQIDFNGNHVWVAKQYTHLD